MISLTANLVSNDYVNTNIKVNNLEEDFYTVSAPYQYKNILNYDRILPDKFFNTEMGIVDNTFSYSVSDFFEIENENILATIAYDLSVPDVHIGIRGIVVYNKNKEPIGMGIYQRKYKKLIIDHTELITQQNDSIDDYNIAYARIAIQNRSFTVDGITYDTTQAVYLFKNDYEYIAIASNNNLNYLEFNDNYINIFKYNLNSIGKKAEFCYNNFDYKANKILNGRNLFNHNAIGIIDNRYLSPTGTIANNDLYFITDFIPINPNTTYSSNAAKGGASECFYDSNFIFIESMPSSQAIQFISPNNAYYIRLSHKYDDEPLMINEGEVLYPYEEYDNSLYDLKDARNEINNLKLNILNNNLSIQKSTISMVSGDSIILGNNYDIKVNKKLFFYANINSFNNLIIGHGISAYGGAYLEIDTEKVKIYRVTTSATLVSEYDHLLSIEDYVYISIDVPDRYDKTIIRILTKNNKEFIQTDCIWDAGSNGNIECKLVDGDLSNATLSWFPEAALNDIWVFGDSYLGYSYNGRFPYHINNYGYRKWLGCGYPGAGSQNEINCVLNLLKLRSPKYIVWTLGMNNPDQDGVINPTYKTNLDKLLQICSANNIIPIIATIPSAHGTVSDDSDITTTRTNRYKNQYIKSLGCRIIDFAAAVEIENGWIDGTLSSDGVHPTEKGAKILANRLILDFPEITTAL